MDVLTHILQVVRAELGEDILNAPTYESIERKLRIAIGAERHYIASETALDRRLRHARIRQALAAGHSAQEVAERFGMTARGVNKIRAARGEEGTVLP